MRRVSPILLLALLVACSDATLSPSPPEPFTAHVTWCSGLQPVWVAFQDGDGAWNQALPQPSGGNVVFARTFNAGRGAIATAFEPGGGVTVLALLYGTPQELESRGVTQPRFCTGSGNNTLQGSVTGLVGLDFAVVWGGFFTQSIIQDNTGFDMQGVGAGPRDFLATRVSRITSGDSLTGIIFRPGVDVVNGATLPIFDFASAEAFAPAQPLVSLSGGLDLNGAVISTRLITSSLDLPLSQTFPQQSTTAAPYPSIPESRLLPGDLQALTVQTHVAGSRVGGTLYFRAPVDRTLGVGGPIVAPQFTTVARQPTLRVRARFAPQAEYDQQTVITYQQGQTVVVVAMTPAYAALIGGYDLEIPELSGTANFNPVWALQGTAQLRWTADRVGGTLGLGTDAVPTEGTVQRSATLTDDLIL